MARRLADNAHRPGPRRSGDAAPTPRAWAARILALRTKEERQQALAEVPEELRELVKKHVEIAWNHPARRNKP
ncbi:hypothetical protein SAMN04244579_03794 [Azotobacter beijerinckii]|uniref:Uncharacterized protein n=1 Tax=Azotobacter beijerinckii TaxID=170623 RepID=A0A1H6XI50_9GAMM|nr:hypothetical protein [Azotobacter beijerinckii]SEJ28753.1 hypothetical protein SAMN04244579_03794 [Azotobacter beijerinckii]